MSAADPVRAIATAVLYEGYLLWPYRHTALKNQQRFTFGGVYPEAFARTAGDRSAITMECLLELGGAEAEAEVEVSLRCLHLVERRPLVHRGQEWAPVPALEVAGERHVAFEEACEREVHAPALPLVPPGGDRVRPVRIPAGQAREPLGEAAVLHRRWEALHGELRVQAVGAGPGVARLSVRFANLSQAAELERDRALRRTFLSAHLVARARGGRFVSATDPPAELADAAAACHNDGVWPVLVGMPGARDTLLGSPIILSDYPAVAPESPGDLFDGGEIDALLIHSLRGLTEAEQAEIRATDPRARELLERSLALEPERMGRLYGAVRELRAVRR